MNIFMIRHVESSRYVDRHGKHTVSAKTVKIYTDLSEARKRRASLTKSRSTKYAIDEYELGFLKEL